MKKPQKMETYDGTRDSNEHVEHMDIKLDYHQAINAMKCKFLF